MDVLCRSIPRLTMLFQHLEKKDGIFLLLARLSMTGNKAQSFIHPCIYFYFILFQGTSFVIKAIF